MDRREELQDRYEDALFALLMDGMAVDEGKKALEENERLKNDPAAEVPEEVDKRCRKTIRRRFTQLRLRAVGRVTGRALCMMAMILGVASFLFVGAFAASSTVRATVLNLVVEVFPDSTSFFFTEEQPQDTLRQVTVGWVPEGFTLVDQGNNDYQSWSIYQGNGGTSLQVICEIGDGITLNVDTENTAYSEIVNINNSEARIYEKEGRLQIIWSTSDKTAFLAITGEGIDRKDMIRIAESIEY